MEKTNPYKKGGMFEGALRSIFENAKKNRNKPTAAETVLWMHLRAGIAGCKFRRQHPIGMYIADFYCYKGKLVIEVDGSIHSIPEIRAADKEKEGFIERTGYSFIRVTNNDVLKNTEKVMQRITATINNIIHKQTPNIGDKSPL